MEAIEILYVLITLWALVVQIRAYLGALAELLSFRTGWPEFCGSLFAGLTGTGVMLWMLYLLGAF